MRVALLSLLLALPLAAGSTPVKTPLKTSAKPQVKFTTNLGAFTLELEPQAAPKTVANFMNYVHKGFYKGTTFHRVISSFMIQGGAFSADMKEKSGDAPIANEAKVAIDAGLHNTRGTIAMARTNDPNSASSQFFINVEDNSSKLDAPRPDGWGYCVFGHVVQGMETVDKIKAVPTHQMQVQHPQAGMVPMGDVPVTPVVITDVQEVKASASGKKPNQKKAKKAA